MWLKATYEDGFVLQEDERDQSPYDEGRNIFHAIYNSRPCAEHGALVEFALIGPEQSHVIDWTKVPNGSWPVRERHMEMRQIGDVLGEPTVTQIVFGYQYERGSEVVREIIEVM